MRKLFLSVCMFLSLITFARQKEWMDPAVNAINRRLHGLLILLILRLKWL